MHIKFNWQAPSCLQFMDIHSRSKKVVLGASDFGQPSLAPLIHTSLLLLPSPAEPVVNFTPCGGRREPALTLPQPILANNPSLSSFLPSLYCITLAYFQSNFVSNRCHARKALELNLRLSCCEERVHIFTPYHNYIQIRSHSFYFYSSVCRVERVSLGPFI